MAASSFDRPKVQKMAIGDTLTKERKGNCSKASVVVKRKGKWRRK